MRSERNVSTIMAMHKSAHNEFDEDRVEYLSHAEALQALDNLARRYLDMSGEEFLRRWKDNDFDDPDSFEVTHVGILAPMLVEDY